MSVCILLVYGFCLDFLRVLYFFYFAFIFAFLFNFMGIIYRLWLSFSTARIMAEVVNKNRDRNVRDSTLDSLCCRCCRCSFFFFFVLVFFKILFLFVFISMLEIWIGSQLPVFVFAHLLAIDRKQKQNWRTNCKRPRPSSDCARRRCRSRWWNEPSRFSFKSKKSCGRKRSWTPKSVDRPKPRNSSKYYLIWPGLNECSL